MRRRGIRQRVIFVALAPALTISAMLGVYFTQVRFTEIEQSLHDTGVAMARQLALASEYGVFAGNQEALDSIAAAIVREAGVIGVAIRDHDGRLLAQRGQAIEVVSHAARDTAVRVDQGNDDSLVSSAPIFQSKTVLEDFYEPSQASVVQTAVSPLSPRVLGRTYVAISKSDLVEKRARLLFDGIAIVLIGVAVGAVLALRMSRDVTRPVVRLTHAVEQIAAGDLDTRIEPDVAGAICSLEEGVNVMVQALKSATADLERRIAEATAELAQKTKEAESANDAKTRFLAVASHDLRQPLHALGLYIAALQDKTLPDEARRLVTQVGKSVVLLQDLLEALLDISRLDAGGVTPTFAAFPVNRLLSRVEMQHAPTAAAKGVGFRTVSCRAIVRSDPLLLERILFNFVSNAVRYTARGKILIGCRRRGAELRLEVWDTGIGIPVDQQRLVFEEFRRGTGSEQASEKGLGLGLAIVERLARLLGHGIDVRSVPGKGSVFAITVARAAIEDLPREPDVAVFDGGLLRNVDVLIIDDDEEALRSMQALLENWKCRVTTTGSGDAALQALQTSGPSWPHVVVSDLRLADGEIGADVLDRVRAVHRDAIGILVSGDASESARALADRHGYPLLTKPVRPAKLRALMEQLLRRNRQSE